MDKPTDDFVTLLKELALDDPKPDADSYIDISEDEGFEEKIRIEINDRETHYTRLLEYFIDHYQIKQIMKHCFKVVFFICMMACFVVIIVLSISISIKVTNMNVEDFGLFVPTLLSAIAGFVTAIVAIPLVVTRYLFDNKEDERLVDLIKNMQAHDIENLNHLDNNNT